MSDPFAVLGLDDTASPAAVRTARRDLAKLHHPDAGGDAEMMRSINQAAGRALQEIANPRHGSGVRRPVGQRTP